jgi:hypothetical protein
MPWKTTKLKFLGLPVRRRTLYLLTLLFAIAAVPLASWAVLNSEREVPQIQRIEYAAAAAVSILLALMGWLSIVRNHAVLYHEEARYVWPIAILLVVPATLLGWKVADSSLHRGRLDYIVPLVFGGMVLVFLLVRWVLLERHPKRSDIVRGGPSRSHRHRSLPVANVMMDEMAKMKQSEADPVAGEELPDEELPPDESED